MPIDVSVASRVGIPRAPGALGAADACREVLTAYFHLSDSGNLAAQAAVFALDMELGHGASAVKGRTEAIDFLASRRTTPGRQTVHLLGNVQMLQVGEREASSYAVFAFYDNQVGDQNVPGGMRFLGLYESHDAFSLAPEGRWMLARHRVEPFGSAP